MLQLLWTKSHKCHNPILSRYQLTFWLQQFFLSQMFLDHENWFFFLLWNFSLLKLLFKIFKIANIYILHLSITEVYSGSFSNVQTQLFIISMFWNVGCSILHFNVKIFVLLIYIVNHISLNARRKLENEYLYTRGGN